MRHRLHFVNEFNFTLRTNSQYDMNTINLIGPKIEYKTN